MTLVLQTRMQNITEAGVLVFVLLWANDKVEQWRKIIIILQVPRSPFFSGRGGDPRLHIKVWMESHRNGPEKLTVCVKGKRLRPRDVSQGRLRHPASGRADSGSA